MRGQSFKYLDLAAIGDWEFKTVRRRRDNLYREVGHALPPPSQRQERQHHISVDANYRYVRSFEAPQYQLDIALLTLKKLLKSVNEIAGS